MKRHPILDPEFDFISEYSPEPGTTDDGLTQPTTERPVSSSPPPPPTQPVKQKPASLIPRNKQQGPVDLLSPEYDSLFTPPVTQQKPQQQYGPDNEQGWASATGSAIGRGLVEGTGIFGLNVAAGLDEMFDYYIKSEPENDPDNWDLKQWARGLAQEWQSGLDKNLPPATAGAKGTWAQGVESATTSMSTKIPAYIAGALAGGGSGGAALSWLGLPGMAVGAIGGGILGMMSVSVGFGIQQYNDAVQRYTKEFVKQGYSPEKARKMAELPSMMEGGSEVATEWLSDVIAGALPVGKLALPEGKILAEASLREIVNAGFWKAAAKSGAATFAGETSTEFLNSVIEGAVQDIYGKHKDIGDVMEDPKFWDRMLDQLGPIAVSSALFGATHSLVQMPMHNKEMFDLLENPVAPKEKRIAAVQAMGEEISKISKTMGDAWQRSATEAVLMDEGINPDLDLSKLGTRRDDTDAPSAIARVMVNKGLDVDTLEATLQEQGVDTERTKDIVARLGSPLAAWSHYNGDSAEDVFGREFASYAYGEDAPKLGGEDYRYKGEQLISEGEVLGKEWVSREIPTLEDLPNRTPEEIRQNSEKQATHASEGEDVAVPQLQEIDAELDRLEKKRGKVAKKRAEFLKKRREEIISSAQDAKASATEYYKEKHEESIGSFIKEARQKAEASGAFRGEEELNAFEEELRKKIANPEKGEEKKTLSQLADGLIAEAGMRPKEAVEPTRPQGDIETGKQKVEEVGKKVEQQRVEQQYGLQAEEMPGENIFNSLEEAVKAADKREGKFIPVKVEDGQYAIYPVDEVAKEEVAKAQQAMPEKPQGTLEEGKQKVADIGQQIEQAKATQEAEAQAEAMPGEEVFNTLPEAIEAAKKREGNYIPVKTAEGQFTITKVETPAPEQAGETTTETPTKEPTEAKKTEENVTTQEEAPQSEQTAEEKPEGQPVEGKGPKTFDEYAREKIGRYYDKYEEQGMLEQKKKALLDNWREDTIKAAENNRLPDKILDDYVEKFGEKDFNRAFRGVYEQEGYYPPSVRADLEAQKVAEEKHKADFEKKLKENNDRAIAEGKVILTTKQQPFKTEKSSKLALKNKGLQDTHIVAPYKDGFGIFEKVGGEVKIKGGVPEPKTAEEVSKLPKHTVYKQGNRYLVRGEQEGGFGDTIHPTLKDARKYAELEAKREVEHEKRMEVADKAATEEEAAKKKLRYIDGFADDVKGVAKEKIIATLNKEVAFNGKRGLRKDKIKDLVDRGYSVKPEMQKEAYEENGKVKTRNVPTGKRVLIDKDGAFFSESDITKTGMDYAAFLEKKKQANGMRTLDEKVAGEENPDIRYSKEGKPTSKFTKPMIHGKVRQVIASLDLRNAPPVEVVQSESDLPAEIQQAIEKDNAQGESSAVYWNGKVWMIADNVHSSDQVRVDVLHEITGHFGLRGVLGDKLDPILDQVAGHYGDEGLKDIAKRYNLDLSNEQDRRIAAEEKLAFLQGDGGKKVGFAKRIYAQIRKALRKAGFVHTMTDADIAALLKDAYEFARTGKQENETTWGNKVSYSKGAMKERDKRYLELAEKYKAGDKSVEPELQKLVDEAAKRSGIKTLEDADTVAYKVRRDPPPKKTITGYKMLKMWPDGTLHSFKVNTKAPVPMGVWLDALPGEEGKATKTGRKQVKAEGGTLAYRPGAHGGLLPFMPQGGTIDPLFDKNNPTKEHPYKNKLTDDMVFVEVEFDADKNYKPEYEKTAVRTKKGDINHNLSGLPYIPKGGYYEYTTNSQLRNQDLGSWLISGGMKINRVLSRSEINKIMEQNGELPQKWANPNFDESVYKKVFTRAGEKLTDPVTYDDNGNIIPLSERFNPNKEDIRYSRKKRLNKDRRGQSQFPDRQKELDENRGRKGETLTEKVKDFLTDVKHDALRKYPSLDPKKYGNLVNYLRVYEDVPTFSKHVAEQEVKKVITGLNEEDYDVFRMNVIFNDLDKAINDGMIDPSKPFHFGYTLEEFNADKKHFEKQMTPEVKKAIERRDKMMNDLRKEMYEWGLITKEAAQNESYFHREVLEYVNKKFKGVGTSSEDVRVKRKGWMKSRKKGASSAFNTEYVESEFKVISQAIAQIETAKVLHRINNDFNKIAELRQQAREDNVQALYEKVGYDPKGDNVKPKDDPLYEFKQTISSAYGKLAKLASEGKMPDPLDSTMELAMQKLGEAFNNHDNTAEAGRFILDSYHDEGAKEFQLLTYLKAKGGEGSEEAAAILKAIDEQNKFINKTVGKDASSWKNFMDSENYTTWRPDKGTPWYRTNSTNDKLIEQLTNDQGSFDEADVKRIIERSNDPVWVIPKDVAETLDTFRNYNDDHFLSKTGETLLNHWKQWILINPMRWFKYNVNNASGDFDFVFAYQPAIIRHYAVQATKDLMAEFRGKASKELMAELLDARKQSILGTGMTAKDIPDITKAMEADRHIMALLPKTDNHGINWAKNAGKKFWIFSKDASEFRENILRLAAYRYFQDEVAKNQNVVGVSPRYMASQVTDHKEKAAMLARDLLGDYGNLTKTSEWMRRKLIPFWSWQAINAPRYYRLFTNMRYDPVQTGRSKPLTSTGLIAWKSGKLALRASALFAMVSLWNSIRYPEEEEELGVAGRRQLHLILGRREDGTIMSVRFQGALSDVLGWFALEDLTSDIRELKEGKATVKEKLKEAAMAPAQRLYQGARPLLKTAVEAGTGLSTYPDFTTPRPVRDPIRHILRAFSLERIYDHVAGKPIEKGSHYAQFVKDLINLFGYETDPAVMAYYDTRARAFKFMEDTRGIARPTIVPNDKSNALYYYKQALRLGDLKAAKKYYDKYKELGGKRTSMLRGIKMIHPLGGIPRKYRRQFLKTLTPTEKRQLQMALKWYSSVYQGSKKFR